MTWVLIKILVQQTGYSEDAIRAKIKKGVWLQGDLWRKAPDGRIVFHLPKVQSWMSGGKA